MTAGGRYGLLAGVVAGCSVPIVEDGGERCWCDGERIYLATDETARAGDGVVVQAAMLAAGTFDPAVVGRTTGRGRLRRRYLTLEAARAVAALDHAVPRSVSTAVREVFGGEPPGSCQESLERARSGEAIPEAPDWFGTIKPARVVLNGGAGSNGTPTDAQLEHAGGDEDLPDELDDEQDSERSRLLEMLSAPIGRNPLSDVMRKILGGGRSPGGEGDGGDELPPGGRRMTQPSGNGRPTEDPGGLGEHAVPTPAEHRYPEWDCHGRHYKPDHCSVFTYDPPVEDGAALPPGDDRRLLAELARLGLAPERHRRHADGDTLDVTALTEFVVDRALGQNADDRVYELRRRTAHDLGVVVLLDITGSTAEGEQDRQVFEAQREVAARLIATLSELGDRVAGYAFHSEGGRAVRMLRIKDFDDRYDLAARRRLASMRPGGYTRLGAAIRHGTHLAMHAAGTPNRLLIVVGDGLPYDDGYEQRYAQEDSRKALSEAVGQGVGCACLSVRSTTDPDVIDRVWGHVPHIELEQVSDLHRDVLPVFRRSLRDAVLEGRDGRQA